MEKRIAYSLVVIALAIFGILLALPILMPALFLNPRGDVFFSDPYTGWLEVGVIFFFTFAVAAILKQRIKGGR